jgi:beta-lactamase class C
MFRVPLNITVIIICSVLIGAQNAPAKTETPLSAAVERIVNFQATRLGVPGIAYGVVADGEVVLKKAAGVKGLSAKDPVTTDTLFQIGSITKTFAAAIAVKLHLRNRLDLNQKLKHYLPNRCPQNQCDGITLAHLLNHTSGIPSAGVNEGIENGDSYEAVITKALNAKKVCPPGTCFQYNNAAYEMVREVIEKVESLPYADVLKKELLVPLKMNHTTTTFAELKQNNNYFVPHLFKNGQFFETSHSSDYYRYPGSSVLNSSLDDMLKFVSAELGNAPAVISPEELTILHKPTTEAPDAYAWFEPPVKGKQKTMISQYAIGHRVLKFPDLTVVYHSGWIKGCKSMMAFFPERKMGVVVLQNSPSQLGFRVLDDLVRYLRTGSAQ